MKTIAGVFAIFLFAGAMAPALAAEHGFTLGEYRGMVDRDMETLDLVLVAMYQTAVYAQGALEHPEVCFTPIPLPASTLRAMIGAELGRTENRLGREYIDSDHVGLVLVNALRSENVCR
jgi:hypothetical protein